MTKTERFMLARIKDYGKRLEAIETAITNSGGFPPSLQGKGQEEGASERTGGEANDSRETEASQRVTAIQAKHNGSCHP